MHDEVAAQPQPPLQDEDALQTVQLLRRAPRHHQIHRQHTIRREQACHLAQKRRRQRPRHEPTRLKEVQTDQVLAVIFMTESGFALLRNPREGIGLDNG